MLFNISAFGLSVGFPFISMNPLIIKKKNRNSIILEHLINLTSRIWWKNLSKFSLISFPIFCWWVWKKFELENLRNYFY